MRKNIYWNIDKRPVSDLLQAETDVKELILGSAFLSEYGVHVIKSLIDRNALSRENCVLFLSKSFSHNRPSQLLSSLIDICNIQIVEHRKRIFHAKIAWLNYHNGSQKIIMGSSNYTRGGLFSNIECNIEFEPDADELAQFKLFFMALQKNSTAVTPEIIEGYKSVEPSLAKAVSPEEDTDKIYDAALNISDPFTPNTYALGEQYFDYADFEGIFPKNSIKSNVPERNRLLGKLQKLHEVVYPDVKKFNIFPHKLSEHLTSSVNPNKFNAFHVNWLGVRYGKSPKELDLFNQKSYDDDADQYGFQKHGCIQFSLFSEAFYIGIYHAVPNGAVDRYFLHEELKRDSSLGARIAAEVDKLPKNRYFATIGDDTYPIAGNGAEIVRLYKEMDQDGHYCSIGTEFKPDDARIGKNQIAATVISEIKTLIPLYNLIVQRYQT